MMAVAAVLAIGLAAAGLAHYLFSAPAVDRDIASQIRRTTGLAVTIGGETRLRLLPQPHIEIQSVKFSDRAATVRIAAPSLTAYLRILPLLVGRIEVGSVTLYHPDIAIAIDRKPAIAESTIGQAAGVAPGGAGALGKTTLLGLIDIVDGRVRLERQTQPGFSFDRVNLSVDWPSVDASADLNGQIAWRGAALSVQAWFAQPIELFRGGQSASILRLQSNIVTLATSGRLSTLPRFQYDGRIFASTPSLRKLIELAGYSFARHGQFADLDLRSDVQAHADGATLTNVNLSLDGNDYEGDLAVENDQGMPQISGTLAGNLIDVTPFLVGVPKPNGAGGVWGRQTLDLADLTFADLDLRVSASRLRLNDMEVDDAALSLVTKPGLIDLALAEATANQGIIKGRVSLAAAKDHSLAFHLDGSGTNIDLRPVVIGHTGNRPFAGTMDASLAVESTGSNFDLLMQGLTGRAQIAVANGTLENIDLIATAQQAVSARPGAKIAIVGGTTAFDQLNLDLRLAKGIASIEQGKVNGPDFHLGLSGSANLANRKLDVSALGDTVAPGDRRRIQSTPIRFNLAGPWEDVHIVQGRPDLHLRPIPPQIDSLPDSPMTFAPTAQ